MNTSFDTSNKIKLDIDESRAQLEITAHLLLSTKYNPGNSNAQPPDYITVFRSTGLSGNARAGRWFFKQAAIRSNVDNKVHNRNVVVLILVYLPVCVKVLITSIAHTNGILPVSRDNVVMLGTRPAHNSTTAPAVMSAIELKKTKHSYLTHLLRTLI